MADELETRLRELERLTWELRVRIDALEADRQMRLLSSRGMPGFWVTVVMAIIAAVALASQLLQNWSP